MTMAQAQDEGGGGAGACQRPLNSLAAAPNKSRSAATTKLYESFKKTCNSKKFKESLEFFSKNNRQQQQSGTTPLSKWSRSGSLGRGQWRSDHRKQTPAPVDTPVTSFCTLPRNSALGKENQQEKPDATGAPSAVLSSERTQSNTSASLTTTAFRLDMGYRSVSVSSLRKVFESKSAKEEAAKRKFRWSLMNGAVLNSVGASFSTAVEKCEYSPLPTPPSPPSSPSSPPPPPPPPPPPWPQETSQKNQAKKSFLRGMLVSEEAPAGCRKSDLEEPKIAVSISGGGPSQPLRANFKILVQRTPSARRRALAPTFPAARQGLRRHASGIGRRRTASSVVASSDGSVDGEGAGEGSLREGTALRRRVSSRCEGGYNLNFLTRASKVAKLISKYDSLGGGGEHQQQQQQPRQVSAGALGAAKHDAGNKAPSAKEPPAAAVEADAQSTCGDEPRGQVQEPSTKPPAASVTVSCTQPKDRPTFPPCEKSVVETSAAAQPEDVLYCAVAPVSTPVPQPRFSLLHPKSQAIYANLEGEGGGDDDNDDDEPAMSLPLVPNTSFLWARHVASLPPTLLAAQGMYDDVVTPCCDTYGYDDVRAPSSHGYVEVEADSMCGYEVVQSPAPDVGGLPWRLLPELPFVDDSDGLAGDEEPLYAEADETRPSSKEPLYESAEEVDAINHDLLHQLIPFNEANDEWVDCGDEEDRCSHPQIRVQLVQRSRSRARRTNRTHAVRRTWSQKMREAQRRRLPSGAYDACWEDEVCVCSSSSLYLGDLDSSIYSSASCRSFSNDSHPDGSFSKTAGGICYQTPRLRSVHFQGDRDELQELAFFVDEEETDVEGDTSRTEEPLYEAIGSELLPQGSSVSAEDSFDSFDSDNTGEERNPLYHKKPLPETPPSSTKDCDNSKPSGSSGIGRIGQQMLHLGRKISGTNADLSTWGFSSLRRKSTSGLSLLPLSTVEGSSSPPEDGSISSPFSPKKATDNARKKRWSFKRFRRKDSGKGLEARKGSNGSKETSTFYVQIKGERRQQPDGRLSDTGSCTSPQSSNSSSSSSSTPDHPRPNLPPLRVSQTVGPRLGRALSSATRPTSPPPAPPVLKTTNNLGNEQNQSQRSSPSRKMSEVLPQTLGVWEYSSYMEDGDRRMSVADCDGYILTSDIVSTSTSSTDGGGFFSDQLADEPLYQFYTQDLLQRNYQDQWSSSEDGYEEVGPREPQKPTAMELVTPRPGSRSLWCELPHVVSSGVLDQIGPQERKLQEAMFEVIASEASYLKSLRLLQSHFVEAPVLFDDKLLSRQDRLTLFGDVSPVRECSERFLSALEQRWQEQVLLSRVADIIYEHATKYFSAYVKYCSNQIHRDKLLRHLQATRPSFVEALKRLEASPSCQLLVLHSFLMLPMQRVTRLPLLMDAVLRRLEPTAHDYPMCQMALAALNKLAQDCNEGARKMERLQELLLLSQQLDFREVSNVALVCGNRWLVKRGEVVRLQWKDGDAKLTFGRRITRQRLHLFLFSDLLVIARKRGEESYLVMDHCGRNMVHITELDDRDRLPSKFPSECRNLMLLTMLQNHDHRTVEMVLSCPLESERTRWYEAVTPRSSENPDERVYEEWDCPQVTVTHAYTAQQPDELSLHISDVVNVLRKVPDGWYLGERMRDGERGWFPANHCQEIASAHLRARNLRQRYRLLELSASFLQQQQGSDNRRHKQLSDVDKR